MPPNDALRVANQRGGFIDTDNLPPGSMIDLVWQVGQQALARNVSRFVTLNPTETNDDVSCTPIRDDRKVELIIFDNFGFNAIAQQECDTYVAGIYHGAALTVSDLALAIWSHPEFAPWIGDVNCLPPTREFWAPPGLESLAISANTEPQHLIAAGWASTPKALSQIVKDYYKDRHAMLCPVRRSAFERTVVDAARSVWLHEIAHIVLGHVDIITGLNAGRMYLSEQDNDESPGPPDHLLRLLEYHADEYAATLVMGNHGTNVDDPVSGEYAMTISVVACMLRHIGLYASYHFSNRAEQYRSHPPLWFSAYQILVCNAKVRQSESLASEFATVSSQLETARQALGSLGNIHSLFDAWLDGLKVETFDGYERYLLQLMDETSDWHDVVGEACKRHPINKNL